MRLAGCLAASWNMRSVAFWLAAAFSVELIPATAERFTLRAQSSSSVPSKSLDDFVHKIGWIPLGDLTADRKHWATGSNPAAAGTSGTYEIVNHKVPADVVKLPTIGDRIRIVARVPVIILDYASTGEDHRLEVPQLRRGLGAADQTDVWLPGGTVVEVQDVRVTRAHGQIRGAWARVTPLPKSLALSEVSRRE